MKCNSCQRLVTQFEADMAEAIYDTGFTMCPSCAGSMRESGPLSLLAPGLRNKSKASEFAKHLLENVEGIDIFIDSNMQGYCWEADIPPREEWEAAAALLEKGIRENS